MDTHTPGTWTIGIPDVHDPLADIAVRIIASGPDAIAAILDTVHDDGASVAHEAVLANARLIAAAPAMLAALREARAEISRINRCSGITVFNPAATTAIDEAIADATR